MRLSLVVVAGVSSALLGGCYVVQAPPRASSATVAPVPPPPGVVIVAPVYPVPAVGYVWGWHPELRFFGWYHPRYGWYRRR